ncbi:MAG: methyltransferase domain-containing protein, partial [Thermodesulfovibrionales bacterium]|nr:methyltransferase domain-containing protein [Thermodesulfovibrionales bacterium]
MSKCNQIFDPRFWSQCWDEANTDSPITFTKATEKKWQTYWNSISDVYQDRTAFDKELARRTVNLLETEGIIKQDFKVLDIGCGTGTYTLPIAKRVFHVYALDSAKEMLNRLIQNASEDSIKNLTIINQSWYRCRYKGEFDLVFTSFCPAIRDTASLMKMHRASRQYLCYVTSCQEADIFKQIRQDLWERLTGKPFGIYRSFDVIYPFNFLYAKGLMPSLKYITHSYTYEVSVEKQIIQHERFFEIFTDVDRQRIKSTVKDYIEKRFKDSIIKTEIKRRIAV